MFMSYADPLTVAKARNPEASTHEAVRPPLAIA